MKKIVVVAIALLVCAVVLGVGGAALLVNENAGTTTEAYNAGSTSFCDPLIDPGCHGGLGFCDPLIDPGCHRG